MRHTTSHLLPAALAILAFLGLALLVHAEAGLTGVDLAVSEAIIAARTAAVDWMVVVVTLFGDATALVLIGASVVVSLALKRAWAPASICALAFISTPLIVKLVKLTVERARPTADLYAGVESFSFPSGHMTNSMVIYGALAIFAAHALTGVWKRPAVAGFVLLIGLIGFSRIYLGAHWPSDVLAAVLLASAMLFLIAWGFDQLPGEGRFARAFTLVAAAMIAVWAVYGFLTLQVALDRYGLDVTPEGTIEVEPEPGGS